MRIFFFLLTSFLSIFFLYYSFKYLEFDKNLVTGVYNSNLFESIFFISIFVLWFYLGRFFCFKSKKNNEEITFENIDFKKENNNFTENSKNNIIKEKKEDSYFSFDFDEDNLKIIEWIWPKVEEVLKNNNIKTLKDLSESGYEELKFILNWAWDNYKIINPRTWPYQAELAVNKQWDKLKDYQDFLIWWIEPVKK